MKFKCDHYIPILKTKAGERWAIDHIPSKSARRITPLFEIHRHKTKDDASQASEICEDLSSVWGHPLFLDSRWLQEDNGDADLIAWTHQCARQHGLRAIPVVRLTYDEDALGVIADIHEEDKRGCLLRLAADDAESHDAIDGVLESLGMSKDAVNLLVDYRHRPMDLATLVPQLPDIQKWKTFTVASGSAPRSLAGLPLHEWHEIDRHDWTSWHRGVTSRLPRKPAFGDYTTRDPGASPDGGKPSVNLRYARSADWQVRIGGKFQEGHAEDMHRICADLVEQDWYSDDDFSQGDLMIRECADENIGPGAPQQWLQWGINHHIMFTIAQIEALGEL